MANIIDLDDFGKKISTDFISDNIDMTESLLKVARDNGLNKQQINRVAETANVETYLSLMKTAEDKYLTYPVADASSVYASLTKSASHIGSASYIDAPTSAASVSDIFGAYDKLDKTSSWSAPIVIGDKVVQVSMCKEAEEIIADIDSSVEDRIASLSIKRLIKTASEELNFNRDGRSYKIDLTPSTVDIIKNAESGVFNTLNSKGLIQETMPGGPSTQAETIKAANAHRGVIALVKNEFNVSSSKALIDLDNLYQTVKQACLSGNTPSEAASVIEQAVPTAHDIVSDNIFKKLAEEAPHLDHEIVKISSVVNEESTIFKAAEALQLSLLSTARLDNALDKLHEKYANFAKENSLPNVLSSIDNERYISSFVKEAVDKTKATPLLAAFIGGNLVGRKTGKNIGRREQGQVLQKVMLRVGKPKKELY